MQTALGAHRLEAPNLGKHLGQEALAAEPRIYGHYQNDITETQDIFDEVGRACRVEYNAPLPSQVPDLGQHPVQVERRSRPGLDQQMVGAGLGEGGEVALRLDDHQMHVERLGRRSADGPQDDRAECDVGDEAPVHDIDVDPVGTRGIYGTNLLAEAREVGREDRRRYENRLHGRWLAITAAQAAPWRPRPPGRARSRTCVAAP
jgi:hypothetical protein